MQKIKFIAELGKDHQGNMVLAKLMIREAKECGFDMVKAQLYDIDELKEDHPNKQRYENCYLNINQLQELKEYAKGFEIPFFVSIFSEDLVGPARTLSESIKIPSTFFDRTSFVYSCIDNFNEIHLSTGFTPSDKVAKLKEEYDDIAMEQGKETVYYQCTSLYPTPMDMLRLNRIESLKLDGLSYHAQDVNPILWSIIKGITHLELHFTVNYKPSTWLWTPKMVKDLRFEVRKLRGALEDQPISSEEENSLNFFQGEFSA